jgi:L-lactate utilization protein LutB
MSTQLPPSLPDARTAQRLLDILSQLEHTLRNGRHANSAAHSDLETRMANLQFENQRLRTTRQHAAERLDVLLERLKDQLTESSQNAVQEDAA